MDRGRRCLLSPTASVKLFKAVLNNNTLIRGKTDCREPAQQLFPSYAFIIPRAFQLMFEHLSNAETPFTFLLVVKIHTNNFFKCMTVVCLILCYAYLLVFVLSRLKYSVTATRPVWICTCGVSDHGHRLFLS